MSTPTTALPLTCTPVRHPWPVRLWHWLTALAFTLSLATGLLIFNIHPTLYWGNDGHAGMPSIAGLTVSDPNPQAPRFDLHIGRRHWDVTRWMGVIDDEGDDHYVLIAPYPSDFHFGGTRVWHFFAAWLLSLGWVLYALYLIGGGRFARSLWPERRDLGWRNVLHEIKQHLLLRPARGGAAARYNVLQKLSYLLVIFGLLPTLIITGLTMSNSMTAAFPELLDLFGGRQSARSLHFIAATLMVVFVAVHLLQVLIVGFFASTRSMITGRAPPVDRAASLGESSV